MLENDEIETAIRRLETARIRAALDADTAAFTALAHPELTYTHSSGAVDTRGSYAEKLRSRFYDYHRIDHPVERVVVLGDTALVHGEMHASLTIDGALKELANRTLAVWVREGGDWRLVAFAPTALPRPA